MKAKKKRVAQTLGLAEFMRKFSTERKAVRWLEALRWRGKPSCAHCGSLSRVSAASSKRHAYWCGGCRQHFTVRTKTIMHSSKLPTRAWLVAGYLLMTGRKGVSSLQLSKELDITQKSAWFMLQRLRKACETGDFQLEMIVEVDETYIGGKERNKHESRKLKAGRGAVGKVAVLGMRERGGRARGKVIGNTDKETLQGEIRKGVAKGSIVFTDEHGGYAQLEELGYAHRSVNHSAKQFVDKMASTNGVESMWSVLKRMHYGTYHHFSAKHLQRYVDECSFRLNEGNCEVDTIDRIAALCLAMTGKRIAYKELVGKS